MKKTLALSVLALAAASADYKISGKNRHVGIHAGTTFKNAGDLIDMGSKFNQSLTQAQDSIMKDFKARKNTVNTFNLGATSGGLSSGNGTQEARDGYSGAGHQLYGHTLAPSFESSMGFSQGNSGGQSIGDTAGSDISDSTSIFGPGESYQSDNSKTNLSGDVTTHTGNRNMTHTDKSKINSILHRDNGGTQSSDSEQ